LVNKKSRACGGREIARTRRQGKGINGQNLNEFNKANMSSGTKPAMSWTQTGKNCSSKHIQNLQQRTL
jgi:hypothetical protein